MYGRGRLSCHAGNLFPLTAPRKGTIFFGNVFLIPDIALVDVEFLATLGMKPFLGSHDGELKVEHKAWSREFKSFVFQIFKKLPEFRALILRAICGTEASPLVV